VLAYGMGVDGQITLETGAALVIGGLSIFAVLMVDNLRRAGNLPLVAAHGWAALGALVLLVVAAIYLIADFGAGFLPDHLALAHVHMVLAVFGFMGLLVAGFSQILVPMFALSGPPPARPVRWQLGLAVVALAGFSANALAGPYGWSRGVGLTAAVLGAMAAAIYITVMRQRLLAGMRKRLGVSFVLIRASWGFLGLGLVIGLLLLSGGTIPNGGALFGFVVLAGWLLTFLLGILQRIMPFLASMHITDRGGRPPLLSDIAPAWPLLGHAVCHFAALALVMTGIVFDWVQVIRLGAVVGAAGALGFCVFAGFVLLRLLRRGL